MISLAHFVSVLYSVSHGLSEMPFSFVEEARKGADAEGVGCVASAV